jgi:hypothetical protein
MSDEGITPQPPSAPPTDERITSQAPAGGRPASDDDWFVRWGGKELGPFTADELKANAAGGALGPEDLVRHGDGQWAPAKRIPFLAPLVRGGARRGPSSDGPPGPVGIGGLLILPAIGLLFGPCMTAFGIFMGFDAIDRRGVDFHLVNVLADDIVLTFCFLLFQVYVAVAFFRRKRAAPKLMVALYLVNIAVNVTSQLMVTSVTEEDLDIAVVARPMLLAALWIPYFLMSRRVKATFTF